MRIDEIIATSGGEPVFSFEFFPPKTDEGERNLRETLEDLRAFDPDFVSVTYGAGGSTRNRTVELTHWIKRDLGIEAMAHLSCVGSTREELHEILDGMERAGIENVLALRGDPPKGETEWRPHPGGLRYSTELASLIGERYPFSVGAACFPEVHPQAPDLASDLHFLKQKVDAGATFLITQLFFDNELYFRFVEEARAIGIDVPILPGVMPITDVSQIKTITGMCGATLPERLMAALGVAGNRSRGGAPAWRRLRDAPVRRTARARRARHPLLHAQSLPGDPRDPLRAAAVAAMGPPRGRPHGVDAARRRRPHGVDARTA